MAEFSINNVPKERDYLFDNLRLLLIFGVVLAHGLETARASSDVLPVFHEVMLCFLMPMFVFVTGYFAKGMADVNSSKRLRIFNIFLLYIITQFIKSVIYDSYTIFTPHYAGWYLVGMIVWYLLTPAFSKLKVKWGLVLAIAFSLVVGMDVYSDDLLQTSRIIAFLPFFLMGLYCDKNLINKIKCGKYRALGVATLIVGIVVYIAVFKDVVPYSILHGNKCYASMEITYIEGIILRCWWYVFSVIMGFGVLSVLPRGKRFFSIYGTRTLAIYILHTILYAVLAVHTDVFAHIGEGDNTMLKFFIMSLVVTAVCGCKWASKPFDWFMGLKFGFLFKPKA